MGCKRVTAVGCLLISLLTALVIFAVIFKPDFLLDPIKIFINQPYATELEKHTDKRIDSNVLVTNPGNVTLSEDEVYNLINDKLPQIKISKIELEDNRIIIFKNIAKKGKPLWVIAELKIENGMYKLDKIGLGRFKLPDGFKDKAITWLGERMNTISATNSTEGNLSYFVSQGLGPLFDPQNVIIKKDEMQVKLIGVDNSKYKEIIDSIDPSKYRVGIEETVKEVTDSIKTFNK